MYTYIYIYIYIYIHTYIHTHIHTYMHTCIDGLPRGESPVGDTKHIIIPLNLTLSRRADTPSAYGRFSEAHGLNDLPDPGASNSCMHTFPETDAGFTMDWHTILHIWIRDMRTDRTGVCRKTLLRRSMHVGMLALRAPTQGLRSSFC